MNMFFIQGYVHVIIAAKENEIKKHSSEKK